MTTSTLAALAAAVEAGLLAGAGCCQDIQMEGYKYTSEENTITNAQAALAEYRRRCEALEAFVGKVHSEYAAFAGSTENSAYEEWGWLDDEARALLEATGGESGESEV